MLPVAIDLARVPVTLVGSGPLARRRLDLIMAGGARDLVVHVVPADAELSAAAGSAARTGLPVAADLAGPRLVFVAGLDEAVAVELGTIARAAGALVNVEDVTGSCDLHVPALVRRGDLTLAVSTGGASPGLARRIRRWLEARLGPEWADRTREIARARDGWRAEGLAPGEVARRTDALIDDRGWLQ